MHLSEEIAEELPMKLLQMYCGKDMRMFSYVMDVLLPECVIRLLMETHDIDYNAAEVLMSTLPEEPRSGSGDEGASDEDTALTPSCPSPKRPKKGKHSDLLAKSRAIAKGKRKALNTHRSDIITVNVCGMEANSKKKGKYETCTSYTEVEVSRRDTYVTFAQKSAFAVGFLDGEDDLALFKPRGGVKVSNECITLQNGVKVPWSIGAYLQRARKSSDKVTFGVAYEVQESKQTTQFCSPKKDTAQGTISTADDSQFEPTVVCDAMEFSYDELKKATNSFTKMIGEGAFGKVYLGSNIRNSGTPAAIKVLNEVGEKAVQDKVAGLSSSAQLHAEIAALMKFRHPNLVGLMGYHNSGSTLALVYEYLPGGSLYSHLHDFETEVLSWASRSGILKDTCRALAYLHGGEPPLIHQDIKSLNILLDVHLTAKLGDFGFAMNMPKHSSGRTLVSAPLLARTDGYFAPELIGRKVSAKSDVYSFGVVILEVFTGMKAYDSERADPELALHCEDALSGDTTVTWKCYADDRLDPPDLNLLTLLFMSAKKALRRHSIRLSSAELMELFDEYSDHE